MKIGVFGKLRSLNSEKFSKFKLLSQFASTYFKTEKEIQQVFVVVGRAKIVFKISQISVMKFFFSCIQYCRGFTCCLSHLNVHLI